MFRPLTLGVAARDLRRVLVLGLLLGCNKDHGSAPAPSASTSARPSGITPELARLVLAKVGEHEITLGEYAATLERMDPFERLSYQSPDRRKLLLDELIDLDLLAEEARRRGLDQRPETRDRIRQMLRDELLAELRARAPAPNELPEADVRSYYERHRDDFREPERRRVAQIVLASEAKAKTVLEKAEHATPAEWGKLVADHSLDAKDKAAAPAAPELAGDLGIVGPPGHPRGGNPKVSEAIRSAVFEIDKLGGVLSRVVADRGQFHVLRLTGKTDARDRTFVEAERSIRI